MSVLSRVIFDADTIAPSVPSGVAAVALSSSVIRISWNASTDTGGSGLSGYRVLRATASGGPYSQVSPSLSVASLVYDNTGLAPSTQFFYRVVAFDGNSNVSAQSTTASATTQAGTSSSVSATEADWLSRMAGPGVVWGHDFRTAAEVNQFRYANDYGHDPNDVARPGQTIWLGTDGIGNGGCMESRHTGTVNPPDWWRPDAPLVAGSNGRSTDDPAVGGSLTRFTYTPNPAGGDVAHNSFNSRGYYGNAIYHGSESAGTFNGTSYFFQMRCKISANRATAGIGSAEGGKLLYFTRSDKSATSQEIVTSSYFAVTSLHGDDNIFSMYRSVSPAIAGDHAVAGKRQVGGEYNGGVCQTSPTIDGTGCWLWPTDEISPGAGRYVTLLYQIIPGTDSGNDTVVRVWKAEWGETSYTKIWDQSDVDLPFEPARPFGHNAIICSGYQNLIDFTEPVWHRYAQLIFSHSFIPCPQVYDTTSNPLIVAAEALSPGQNTSTIGGNNGATGLTSSALFTIQWVNRFYYDHERDRAIVLGKEAIGQGGERGLMICDFNANTWTTTTPFDINGIDETGHIYESFAYDPKAQQIYNGKWDTSPPNSVWIHTLGDPLTTWTQTAVAPYGMSPNGSAPVLCWHPNLFGVGDGGLILIRHVTGTTMHLVTWRKSTNTWSVAASPLVSSTAPSQHGAMTYVRAFDAVFATHAGGNTYRINAGSGGVAATPVLIANPPIQCRHIGGGGSGGILLDDPSGLGGPYILAKGTGTGSVWKYEGTSWTSKSYTHPFPTESLGEGTNWCAAPMFPLGVFMCRRNQATTAPLLWRPND